MKSIYKAFYKAFPKFFAWAVFTVMLSSPLLLSCGEEKSVAGIHAFPDVHADSASWQDVSVISAMGEEQASGVRYRIVKKGEGSPLQVGEVIRVQYTGWYENGKKYASSFDRSVPFRFRVAKGEVIEAWDMTMDKVNRGGQFYVVVPPQYGDEKDQKPEGITLIFGIEVLRD